MTEQQAWASVEAGELGQFKDGTGFPKKLQGNVSGDYPFYKVSDMNLPGNEKFMRSSKNFVSEKIRDGLSATALPKNSIVFAKVGAAVFLERKRLLSTTSCLDNNMAAFIPNPKRMDPIFAYHALTNYRLSSLVAVGALPSLNGRQLRSISFKIPPALREQRKVADALDDADMFINTLERLIAKKYDIKQGMMQELLTGRTRLTGFTEGWRSRRVGEIANVIMGQSPPGSSYNLAGNGVPLIQGNADVKDRRTFERVWTTSPTKMAGEGDVVLTVRAPVGFTARAHAKSCLGRGVCALSSVESNDFLFHAMVAAESKWGLFEQGSTFTSVNSDQVRSFVLEWPSDVEEQVAIATVLQDADAEIKALERRLESARAVKAGMMLELLTGRTRLPVKEDT
jgi:type I restriction enzyme S subunit